ncbi:putative methyltransferase [Nymphaea thermarum]|nr:putative methyltransferase [Nymphaea thermarum]
MKNSLSTPTPFVKLSAVAVLVTIVFILVSHWMDVREQIVFITRNSGLGYGGSSDADLAVGDGDSTLHWVTFGVLDENGKMTENFRVSEFDSGSVVDVMMAAAAEEEDEEEQDEERPGAAEDRVSWKAERFLKCPASMRDYVPCLEEAEEGADGEMNPTVWGERFERHCSSLDSAPKCLVPPPAKYRRPIRWPISRDQVWYYNVPQSSLAGDDGEEKSFVTRTGDKLNFSDHGSQFPDGANKYLNQIATMVPGIGFGSRTRVALDLGSGIATFGAFLWSRNVTTMSIAPKDLVHGNQVQLALERGVPAMVGSLARRRLLYPSQAFELVHCSSCQINWTRDDGVSLLEVNRLLRAGGYFVWAAEPVYKGDESSKGAWKGMEKLTASICWNLVKKEGHIAIWKKPTNNSCYLNREDGAQPPLCEADDDIDNVWNVNLKPCISRLPENGFGGNISTWPARLHSAPDRLRTVDIDVKIAHKEHFRADSNYWKYIVRGYVRAFRWGSSSIRNVLDMRAGFGGILRPGGFVYIRDFKKTIEEIHQIAFAMGWRVSAFLTSEGPYSGKKLLRCEKPGP